MYAQRNANVIGVDLGGTNVRAGVVSSEGEIVARQRIATPNEDGMFGPPERLIDAIAECIAPLLAAYPECRAIGVGSGGQFNPATGNCLGTNTRDARFVGFPMAQRLRDRLGLRVFIDNDVKMAAYGEMRKGGGRAFADWLFVAVGTGVGGAVVLQGNLYHGRSGLAGHLGLFPDPQTGAHIESIAGGVPLGNAARERGIIEPDETTEDLFRRARRGELQAAECIRGAGECLGRVLAGLVHTLDPECIVAGGSVGIQPEYLAAINAALEATLMPAWRSVRAVPAQLGTDAGLIGAGLCALDEISRGG